MLRRFALPLAVTAMLGAGGLLVAALAAPAVERCVST